MPTTGTPLLIVAVLTSVTISSSSCILDVSQYQSPSETNENLFPCVKSVYTRTEDACRIADLNEGRARTNATQCVIEHRYIECYCSEKCSEDELRTLVRSLANEGTPWEKNCIKNFLENWKNATSTALTSGTTNGSKDASELRMSEAEKSMADEGGESFTRKTLVPEVSGSSHANQTTENERRELRMARERLLKATTFKLFWISCMMAFFMVCQMVLVTMIRYESMHYAVAPSTLTTTTESSLLEAQRTSSASSTSATASRSAAAIRRARTPRTKPSTTTSIVRGDVSALTMPKSGDWYQFKNT
ncbi:hypothetical protein Y032_0088g2129 [Ancylostoma ceylanicum]|nr:hypothetical protein Y032_0088g2129 [Ancylostoma ceylanicum]